MKTFYALLIAALFTTAACGKKDEAKKTEPAKTDPAAKPTEPTKTDPATPDPAKADPAKVDPAKTEPAKTEPVATEPAKTEMTAEQAATKNLEFTDKLAKAVTEAGTDCAKIGAALKGLEADAKAAAALEVEISKDPAKKKEYDAKYDKAANAKMKAPMKNVEKCLKNADVKAFIDTMMAEKDKAEPPAKAPAKK